MSSRPRSRLRDQLEEVVDRLRPALVVDGGNLEIVEVSEDGTVQVVLQGACATCPAQATTLRFGIEAALRREMPEVRAVVLAPADPGDEASLTARGAPA